MLFRVREYQANVRAAGLVPAVWAHAWPARSALLRRLRVAAVGQDKSDAHRVARPEVLRRACLSAQHALRSTSGRATPGITDVVRVMPASAQRLARSGYTLLEVLLALSIAVLLLGALYVAMDLQLRHADAGREV